MFSSLFWLKTLANTCNFSVSFQLFTIPGAHFLKCFAFSQNLYNIKLHTQNLWLISQIKISPRFICAQNNKMEIQIKHISKVSHHFWSVFFCASAKKVETSLGRWPQLWKTLQTWYRVFVHRSSTAMQTKSGWEERNKLKDKHLLIAQ